MTTTTPHTSPADGMDRLLTAVTEPFACCKHCPPNETLRGGHTHPCRQCNQHVVCGGKHCRNHAGAVAS